MFLKFISSAALIVFCINLAKAQITQGEVETKRVMNEAYESYLKLIPYIYSEEKSFENLSKKDTDEIISKLDTLSKVFKNAKHVDYLKGVGFRPTLDSINNHLEDTIIAFKGKNKFFAKERLKAIGSLCVSCHSGLSDRVSENAFGDALSKIEKKSFDSDYSYANYLYLVRRFSDAKSFYQQSIRFNIKKIKENSGDIVTINKELKNSLLKVISIYTKVALNPSEALRFLKSIDSDLKIVPTLYTSSSRYKKSLEIWKHFEVKGVKDINAFIKNYLEPLEQNSDKILNGDEDITLLISSGVLSKYLNDHMKSDETPAILYWLSIAERRLSSGYFFSLSDLYLKECIKSYSSSPFAKKCYDEYENQIKAGFSGSSGTDIPEEEKVELAKLKAILR
jgi:hypothetical protein